MICMQQILLHEVVTEAHQQQIIQLHGGKVNDRNEKVAIDRRNLDCRSGQGNNIKVDPDSPLPKSILRTMLWHHSRWDCWKSNRYQQVRCQCKCVPDAVNL